MRICIVSLLFFLILFLACSICLFAQSNETLTIATYYPSPYGIYNHMQANRVAVGDANNNSQLDAGDQPNNDGDIRLKAHTNSPPSEGGMQGEIAYAPDGYLYVHNGSSWVKQGGGWLIPTDVTATTALNDGNFGGYQAMNIWGGLIMGLLLGLFQYINLRNKVESAGLWIAANLIGWGVALALFPWLASVMALTLTWAVCGLIGGAITGFVISRLVHHPQWEVDETPLRDNYQS